MAGSARLAGRTAVITGAGSGIGRETARRFAAEGAAVACLDLSGGRAEEVAVALRAVGADVRARAVDVASSAQVVEACAWIAREWGDPDVLVNLAGGGGAGAIGTVSHDEWRLALDVNLGGAFLMATALWSGFVRRRRGVILNCGSIMGLAGDMNSAAYCSAKAGLVGLTRSLAADGAAHGIRANCVCPGFVDTPAMRELASDPAGGRRFEDFVRQIPMRRMATPAEVASAFLFLASDDAAYITGSTLVVDGGATLGYLGSDIAASADGQDGAVP
ncbi:MAG TPA: SDR family oxidoreductase [Steroidobacteraceae bacterium]|mgnify:CR=1 FL=1|jgi:3-oxoacyl-[acyl-carrier protein] reductase|nr:SDR family oxidoreductase [Steroidobacteraceae bacterium]